MVQLVDGNRLMKDKVDRRCCEAVPSILGKRGLSLIQAPDTGHLIYETGSNESQRLFPGVCIYCG